MRAIILAGVLLATTAATEPAATSLKPFEFKGYTAGSAVSAEQIASCDRKQDDIIQCRKISDLVAGVDVGTYVDFYKNRMTGATVILLQNRYLPEIVRAFSEKYGPSCKTAVEKWQSVGGLQLDNTVQTWCFTTGKLVVKQYGAQVDVPWIQYDDEHEAPTAPVKVDF